MKQEEVYSFIMQLTEEQLLTLLSLLDGNDKFIKVSNTIKSKLDSIKRTP